MSRKLNLYNVPDPMTREEAAAAERRLEMKKAQAQDKKAIAKAIKDAPQQVLTGRGVVDCSAQAALESGLQGPQAQDSATRLAELKKERDELLTRWPWATPGRTSRR